MEIKRFYVDGRVHRAELDVGEEDWNAIMRGSSSSMMGAYSEAQRETEEGLTDDLFELHASALGRKERANVCLQTVELVANAFLEDAESGGSFSVDSQWYDENKEFFKKLSDYLADHSGSENPEDILERASDVFGSEPTMMR